MDDALIEQNSDRVPALIATASSSARFAYDEFFHGRLRNPSTRKNYRHAVHRFLAFCDRRQRELHQITPRDVGDYLDQMTCAIATQKLHLAALRHFFDALVSRHAIILNPAASVRAPRLQVLEGKTPEIGVAQARKLLNSIDTSNLVGLRDRAIIGILIYTAARVGAVADLKVGHFYDTGQQHCLRLHEKGGKSREIPCRHDLQLFLHEYLQHIENRASDSPLFRTTIRRTRELTDRAMSSCDIARMVKRRCRRIHLSHRLSPHSFRVTTLTDLLDQGIPLEDVGCVDNYASQSMVPASCNMAK
jgi:integrase/recombinase XerD